MQPPKKRSVVLRNVSYQAELKVESTSSGNDSNGSPHYRFEPSDVNLFVGGKVDTSDEPPQACARRGKAIA